eukprot:7122747-Prymnesium_polylepis.1
MFARCSRRDNRTLSPGSEESFAVSALRAPGVGMPAPLPGAALVQRLERAARERAARQQRRLSCDSTVVALSSQLLLLLGVPSKGVDPLASRRRDAARSTWLHHSAIGRKAAACFLVSAFEPAAALEALALEAERDGDLIFLQAPETAMLISQPTKYSGYRRAGRAMPTFKQYAFFRHAARLLPSVPYVGKVDDDTLVSLPTLLPLLGRLRCLEYALIGAINWAAFVPRSHATGVMGDRCGFAWSRVEALTNFGLQVGTPGTKGYAPACDEAGAVLPFPYAAGAGYVLSAAALQFIAGPLVSRWVAEASGPRREEYQWQKYEDTTTGYWLSYAPRAVAYVNVQRWVHNMLCHKQGHLWSKGGGMLRPPSDTTILVHDLKSGGFEYAWQLAQHGAAGYEHEACVRSLQRSPRTLRGSLRAERRVARGG